MQEKYYTLYQLKGSSTKQGLQMPTCNNLDQSRIHHLEKKKPYPQHHYKVLHPPPPQKKKKKKKPNQPNKRTNKQITHDQEFTI